MSSVWRVTVAVVSRPSSASPLCFSCLSCSVSSSTLSRRAPWLSLSDLWVWGSNEDTPEIHTSPEPGVCRVGCDGGGGYLLQLALVGLRRDHSDSSRCEMTQVCQTTEDGPLTSCSSFSFSCVTLRVVLLSESCFCRRITSTLSLIVSLRTRDQMRNRSMTLAELTGFLSSRGVLLHLCLSACCLLISLTVSSTSLSFSLSVSRRVRVVSSSSVTLAGSVTQAALSGGRRSVSGGRMGRGGSNRRHSQSVRLSPGVIQRGSVAWRRRVSCPPGPAPPLRMFTLKSQQVSRRMIPAEQRQRQRGEEGAGVGGHTSVGPVRCACAQVHDVLPGQAQFVL